MRLISNNTWRLLKYGMKYKKYQISLLLAFVPPLVLMILRPFFIQFLIDDIVTGERRALLVPFLLLFVLTIVLERIASFILNYLHVKVKHQTVKAEQIELYRQIQRLKPDYFSQHSTGEILTKVLSDIQQVAATMVLIVPTVIFNLVALVSYLAVLSLLSWRLTLISLCSIPLYYISLHLFTKNLRTASSNERKAFSQVNESLREKVEGFWVIKGLNKLGFFSKLFADDVSLWVNLRNKLFFSHISAQNVTYFITAITPVIVLGYGGFSVMAGTLTLGSLMGYFSYINWIYEPLDRINENLIDLQTADPVAERFFELIDTPKEVDTGELAFPVHYSLQLNHLHFGYSDELILNELELEVGENASIAIVGMSGSGKSTLMNLLTRFYSPTAGEILLDGKDLSQYQLEELRKNIQIVRQYDYLFNMTVKENIILDDSFTEAEIKTVTQIAGVDDYVDQLPNRYDTVIGERGSSLSDGQKQRLCLARALIRKPKILILDEATSAIDSNTEEKIFERLKAMKQTVIIISHRLSTIRKADQIVVLHHGKTLTAGKHDVLLQNCSEYTNIIASQLSDTEKVGLLTG